MDLAEKFEGEIEIILTPISGHFDAYVSTQVKKPLEKTATWKTDGEF